MSFHIFIGSYSSQSAYSRALASLIVIRKRDWMLLGRNLVLETAGELSPGSRSVGHPFGPRRPAVKIRVDL